MSLLDRGSGYQPCTVYMETTRKDADDNTVTRAGNVGIPAMARFQIFNQSGTSSRLQESNDEGYQTEMVYSMQLTRAWEAAHGPLQAQAIIGWGVDSQGREARYEVFGDAIRYSGSRTTAHRIYTLRRY